MPNSDNLNNPRKGKTLQQELAEYQRALQEEWTESVEEAAKTDTQILAEKTRLMLLDGTPGAIATIVYLAAHSPHDQVRAGCAKFIIGNALNRKGSAADLAESPLDKLLKDLNKTPKPSKKKLAE